MTYTPILNSEVDAESPITDLLLTRLRDNPIAIANGDADAPRIQFAALDAWFSTAGAIGSYGFFRRIGSGTSNFGDTLAGSNLQPGVIQGDVSITNTTRVAGNGASPAGTWRCMGYSALGPGSREGFTLWLRIS